MFSGSLDCIFEAMSTLLIEQYPLEGLLMNLQPYLLWLICIIQIEMAIDTLGKVVFYFA